MALILDQRGDDYRTQPLGNAGDRIACGVVMRTAGPAQQDGMRAANPVKPGLPGSIAGAP